MQGVVLRGREGDNSASKRTVVMKRYYVVTRSPGRVRIKPPSAEHLGAALQFVHLCFTLAPPCGTPYGMGDATVRGMRVNSFRKRKLACRRLTRLS